MMVASHSHYSGPLSLNLFPKMKLNLKGMEFNDVSEIQQNLEPVLNDSTKKGIFRHAFHDGKTAGPSTFSPKATTLKMT
jgi:hypothetical protein